MFRGLFDYGAAAVPSVGKQREKTELFSRLVSCYHRVIWKTDKGDRVMVMPEKVTPFTL